MRRKIDRIQIKEPPMKELKKRGSCFTRTCLTGCGCVIIFIVAFLATLKFATTPSSRAIKELPEYAQNFIPVYDKDSIEEIRLTAGKDRGRAIERAALLPKVLLSPLLVTLERHAADKQEGIATYIDWEAVKKVIEEPVADHRDVIRIEWQDLPAKPSFVFDFYQTELKKSGFNLTITSDSDRIKQFIFRNSKENIDGVLFIEDEVEESGTTSLILTINIPAE